MTKFNIGDRVMFRAAIRDTAYSAVADSLSHLNGSLGTVAATSYGSVVRVNWDSPSGAREAYEKNSYAKDANYAACFIANLVPASPTPVATPATALRLRARDLRDEARALEDNADALDRAADILDGAK